MYIRAADNPSVEYAAAVVAVESTQAFLAMPASFWVANMMKVSSGPKCVRQWPPDPTVTALRAVNVSYCNYHASFLGKFWRLSADSMSFL